MTTPTPITPPPTLAASVADAFDEAYIAVNQAETLDALLEKYQASQLWFRMGVDAAFRALSGFALDDLISKVTAQRLAIEHDQETAMREERDDPLTLRQERDG